jgi:hypothetical protein
MEENNVNPTGALALPEVHVNTEQFSSQANILASMDGDVKGRDVLISEDSPSGTLERVSKNTTKQKSPVQHNNKESVDGFQRFGEVSTIYIKLYVKYRVNCQDIRSVHFVIKRFYYEC